MIKDFHPKLIGTTLAFSILFFGLYNHYFNLADCIRTITINLLIIGFIVTWMQTKKVSHFILSMALPLWIILLMNPTKITDHLAFLEQEKQLEKLAFLVQYDNNYQKMVIYTISDNEQLNTSYNLFESQLAQPIDQLKDNTKLSQIKSLLKRTNLAGFQLGHGCIVFYFLNRKALRYYYKKIAPYAGDQKIKPNWYWIEHSFYE